MRERSSWQSTTGALVNDSVTIIHIKSCHFGKRLVPRVVLGLNVLIEELEIAAVTVAECAVPFVESSEQLLFGGSFGYKLSLHSKVVVFDHLRLVCTLVGAGVLV